MTVVRKISPDQKSSPFDNAAMFALRLGTSLIVAKACIEVSEFETDVEIGLDELDLPPEIRVQVMMDYISLKERWDLLFATPLYID